jgi:hypothetical protein
MRSQMLSAEFANELAEAFPSRRYPYVISRDDLDDTENKDFVVLRDDGFLVKGQAADNFDVIKKDTERKVNLNSQVVSEISLERLQGIFGVENAKRLVASYSQVFSYYIGASKIFFPNLLEADSQGNQVLVGNFNNENSDENEEKAQDNSPTLYQNIYLKNETVFRIAEQYAFKILLDGGMETWKFKSEIKVFGRLTQQGFMFEGIGTDSPLICNFVMGKNAGMLEKIVQAVKTFREEYGAHLQGLTMMLGKQNSVKQKENLTKKIDLVKKIQAGVKDFTDGKINFAELTMKFKEWITISKSIPHAGRFTQFSKTDSPTTGLLQKHDEKFSVLQNEMKAVADKYHNDFGKQIPHGSEFKRSR